MQQVPPSPLPAVHRPPSRPALVLEQEAARSELPLPAGQQPPASIAQGLAVIIELAGAPSRDARAAHMARFLVAVAGQVTPGRPPAARAGVQSPEPRQVASSLHPSPPEPSGSRMSALGPTGTAERIGETLMSPWSSRTCRHGLGPHDKCSRQNALARSRNRGRFQRSRSHNMCS